MDTLIINEGDNTFLVPTEIVGELMEVTLNNGNYSCECNKLTPWENECDHIKQVINKVILIVKMNSLAKNVVKKKARRCL